MKNQKNQNKIGGSQKEKNCASKNCGNKNCGEKKEENHGFKHGGNN
jgi:hypothetical protein